VEALSSTLEVQLYTVEAVVAPEGVAQLYLEVLAVVTMLQVLLLLVAAVVHKQQTQMDNLVPLGVLLSLAGKEKTWL
jgi:hypothetical protein